MCLLWFKKLLLQKLDLNYFPQKIAEKFADKRGIPRRPASPEAVLDRQFATAALFFWFPPF